MIRSLTRTTLRINNNLKARISILAVENNISFNKMVTYLIELGYSNYMKNFDNYYQEQKKLRKRC